jgi:hypothetical protein
MLKVQLYTPIKKRLVFLVGQDFFFLTVAYSGYEVPKFVDWFVL